MLITSTYDVERASFDFAPSVAEVVDQYDRERIERDTERAELARVAARPYRRIVTVDS